MNMCRRSFLVFGSLLASFVSSCGSDTTTPPPPPPPPAGGTVQTVGTNFEPANLTVTAGTTVKWVDSDGVVHTVTSGTGSTASNVGQMFDMQLSDHQTVQFMFTTPGTYPYFCRIHEGMNMRGTITVTSGTGGAGGSGGMGGSGGGGGAGGY
jgi:plastocyanin